MAISPLTPSENRGVKVLFTCADALKARTAKAIKRAYFKIFGFEVELCIGS